VVRVTRTIARACCLTIAVIGSVLLVAGVVNMNATMIGVALVQLLLAALVLARPSET
jgi:ribose/xylose/arabinose/galactoside ABC-type transport system permease subunit